MRGIIQIAGVHDAIEARGLVAAGVDWIGFPLRLTVHAEDLTDEMAARVVAGIPPPCRAVLITYLDQAADILALCDRIGVRMVQLHGDVVPDVLRALKDAAPDIYIVKSIVIRPGHHLTHLYELVDATAEWVDAYITDTFDPRTGASGATGCTHDWSLSRCLVEYAPRPVLLAGGLRPENVVDAIRQVRPAGVDAHTGVEGPSGRKDPHKVRAFVSQAREAFDEMESES